MGVNKYLYRLEMRTLKKLEMQYSGMKLLEFGSMWHRVMKKPAKIVYEGMGVIHRSIDLNGKYGSLPLDLGCPLPEEFKNWFNLVTNYGTIEHVNNQYQVFKNAHDALVIGGIAIHGLPRVGTYEDHCRYYYDRRGMELIGRICGYSVVEIGEWNFSGKGKKRILVYVVFQKNSHEFPSEDNFPLHSIHDTGDLRRTGNYNS